MRNATKALKSVVTSDEGPAPLQRRSFLGRVGGMLAALLAGVPLIRIGVRAAGEVSAATTSANPGRIRPRIHPMAVARKTSRPLPNV